MSTYGQWLESQPPGTNIGILLVCIALLCWPFMVTWMHRRKKG